MRDKTILIIDDNVELLRRLEQVFRKTGYQVYTAEDGEAGLQQLVTHHPDIIILDLFLPKLHGREVCRQIRQHTTVPILIITGMGSEEDHIDLLKEGADDYLLKPFRFDLLLTKVEAMLRREGFSPSLDMSQVYSDDYLVVDLLTHEVFVQGQPVHMKPKEYELLEYLIQRAGQLLSHHQILEDIWHLQGDEHLRNVHLHISRLRHKIEVNPRQPRYILTVPRIGYRFQKASPQ